MLDAFLPPALTHGVTALEMGVLTTVILVCRMGEHHAASACNGECEVIRCHCVRGRRSRDCVERVQLDRLDLVKTVLREMQDVGAQSDRDGGDPRDPPTAPRSRIGASRPSPHQLVGKIPLVSARWPDQRSQILAQLDLDSRFRLKR